MKFTEKTLVHDIKLGPIIVRPNRNSRQIKFRITEGQVTATVPYGISINLFKSDLDSLREQIYAKLKENIIEYKPGIIFKSFWLTVFLEKSDNPRHILKGENDHYIISAPQDISDNGIITNGIYKCLKHRAYQVLPEMVQRLAEQFGFRFNNLKINSSKGRWGSCSSAGNINISMSVMTLPEHLTKYVILHELCHTVHMSHDKKFYELLDKCSDGKSESMKNELKKYSTRINNQQKYR